MIIPRYHKDLGTFKNAWLNAHYHFSFAQYHDPKHVRFGTVRVINDDVIAANSGFGMHPHEDMEIITYVRTGAIYHKDSLGNEGVTKAGDVQVMSAGTGIMHGERSGEGESTTLYQIWILPNQKAVEPRWDTRQFPKDKTDEFSLLVSGDKDDENNGALFIYQDAKIYGGNFASCKKIELPKADKTYLLVSKGEIEIKTDETITLAKGDGAMINEEPALKLEIKEDAELLLITQ